jgi:hypothetical protein
VTPERTARLSLLLSALTLAAVLVIAFRPAPEQADFTPGLRADIAQLQQSVDELRLLVEAGAGGGEGTRLAEQLNRMEAALATLDAKVEAICSAIESSPFAPSGFACP